MKKFYDRDLRSTNTQQKYWKGLVDGGPNGRNTMSRPSPIQIREEPPCWIHPTKDLHIKI